MYVSGLKHPTDTKPTKDRETGTSLFKSSSQTSKANTQDAGRSVKREVIEIHTSLHAMCWEVLHDFMLPLVTTT